MSDRTDWPDDTKAAAEMANTIASLTADVAEWKAAASTEANLRREFLARAETAEAENEQLTKLAKEQGQEIQITRDRDEALESQIERLRGVIEDAIETLEAMDLHVDNPLYERLCAALQSSEDGK